MAMKKLPRRWLPVLAAMAAVGALAPGVAESACCYFSAKDADVLQPAQKAFITWDAKSQAETFTVQPRFEGNAQDFGMVIPTPSRPKLDEMPRDFFKELAVYTILKKREQPRSKLLPYDFDRAKGGGKDGSYRDKDKKNEKEGKRPNSVVVLEAGVVGSLDYKILSASRADDLYAWLKANKYKYAGDEATLNFYVKKKWFFTVMKIDTMQMKKNKDGSYTGEVTPTRFQFKSEKLVYPLKITQLSVKDKTEALFYVQTERKVDLPGDLTYQYQWVPMLQNAQGWYAKGIFGTHDLPGKADDWLKSTKDQAPDLLRRGQELGFAFQSGTRPQPNKQGRIATTLEWAKHLKATDIKLLKGDAAYSEKVPDPDAGFTAADVKDPKKAEAVYKVIRERLAKYHKERPGGYLVREAPAADVKNLKLLAGYLKEGQFLTKFRKTFTKGEMDDDLLIVVARLGQAEDHSEYEEILPTSPP
jgi:hypothetical protein